jgi:hypothetical protein
MQRPTCYISMPFGRKQLADGQEVNFESVYAHGIRPAVEMAGMTPTRADALVTRGSIMKAVFEMIFESDVMIADVTGANANVLYELGMRHAIAPQTTIIIRAGNVQLPFDIAHLHSMEYQVEAGELRDAERLHEQLYRVLEQRSQQKHVDSPFYEYFPELATTMPRKAAERRTRAERKPAEALRELLLEARRLPTANAIAELRQLEQAIMSEDVDDSSLVADLLLGDAQE